MPDERTNISMVQDRADLSEPPIQASSRPGEQTAAGRNCFSTQSTTIGSRSRDGSRLHAGIGSNRTASENGHDQEENRATNLEVALKSGRKSLSWHSQKDAKRLAAKTGKPVPPWRSPCADLYSGTRDWRHQLDMK
jgi:hypothetical protein